MAACWQHLAGTALSVLLHPRARLVGSRGGGYGAGGFGAEPPSRCGTRAGGGRCYPTGCFGSEVPGVEVQRWEKRCSVGRHSWTGALRWDLGASPFNTHTTIASLQRICPTENQSGVLTKAPDEEASRGLGTHWRRCPVPNMSPPWRRGAAGGRTAAEDVAVRSQVIGKGCICQTQDFLGTICSALFPAHRHLRLLPAQASISFCFAERWHWANTVCSGVWGRE